MMWPWRKRKKQVAVCVECRWHLDPVADGDLGLRAFLCRHPKNIDSPGRDPVTGEPYGGDDGAGCPFCESENPDGNCRKFEPKLGCEPAQAEAS